jgi:hypothetical protein
MDYDRDQDAIRLIILNAYAKVREMSVEPADDQDCIESVNGDAIDFATFYISDTNTGLYVVPSLPHVVFDCTEDVFIPTTALEPYLASDSILRRLIAY